MKKRLCVATLCMIALVSQVGCSTTQRLADSKIADSQLATIRVHNQIGSGQGARISQIKSVDGKGVDADSDYVTVEAGSHDIYFDFSKITDPGGSLGFSLIIFGNENEIIKPREERSVDSTDPIRIRGDLSAGRTYYVDVGNLDWEPIPLTKEGQFAKKMLGDNFQQHYVLTGSAYIREKK